MKKILIIMTGVFISFDLYYLYPISLALIIVFYTNFINKKIGIDSIVVFIVSVVFLISFLFSVDAVFLERPFLSILKYIVIIFSSLILVVFSNKNSAQLYIVTICLSMIINGLGIIGYSYFLSLTTDGYYGYGRLFNPFHNVETVSPKVALSIISPLAVYAIMFNKRKFFGFVLLALSITSFIFIESRAAMLLSFIVLGVFSFSFFCSLSKSKKFTLIFSAFLVSLVIVNNTFNDIKKVNNTGSELRLVESGLQSRRFLHWEDGLSKIITHPLGGFSVDSDIERVNYFHNIIIDSARVYGWFAIFLLLIIFHSQYKIAYSLNEKLINKYIISLTIVNVVMMQDVVIEGNFLLFSLSLSLSLYCLEHEKKV